jgi:hypothetical protein
MFSLRTLFLVVALAALATAALFANTYWLISAFVVLTLAILSWSFLQRDEPLWRGLCLFGTVYLLCAVVPSFRSVSDMLPSTRLREALIETSEEPLENPFGVPPPPDPEADPFGQPRQLPAPDPFRDTSEYWPGKQLVLHCTAALLFGTAGALLLQWSSRHKKPSA